MSDDTIQFRAMTAEDIPAGLRLCRLARWNQLQRDWELFLQLSPAGCRVAVKDGQVIGTVTTVNYENIFSWIGMVLVDPAERRQGIGARLMREALDVLKDEPLVGLDATPAGHEVYLKLGFTDECSFSRMETVVEGIATDENNPARQMTAADLLQVFELDRKVFGADRRLMLEWMFAGAPELAWVLPREGNIVGYALGRHGFNFEHLGPVVAEDVQSAKQLVSAYLAEQAGKPFIIDAAHHEPEWLRWLEAAGFKQQRPFIRMFRGDAPRPGLPEKQFAILGPEFG
ncbi:MAG: GNAT family N-acetyltransferase [Blastocatellia bacterium]